MFLCIDVDYLIIIMLLDLRRSKEKKIKIRLKYNVNRVQPLGTCISINTRIKNEILCI